MTLAVAPLHCTSTTSARRAFDRQPGPPTRSIQPSNVVTSRTRIANDGLSNLNRLYSVRTCVGKPQYTRRLKRILSKLPENWFVGLDPGQLLPIGPGRLMSPERITALICVCHGTFTSTPNVSTSKSFCASSTRTMTPLESGRLAQPAWSSSSSQPVEIVATTLVLASTYAFRNRYACYS